MAAKVINISLPPELLAMPSWTAADRRSWAALSESALRRIWDNDKDAAYDTWRPKEHGQA